MPADRGRRTIAEEVISGAALMLLQMRVHLDALMHDPAAYLKAIYWRILGKKLRARHRMSALKGTSLSAYRLWMATREGANCAEVPSAAELPTPIVVVVDCRRGGDVLSRTLSSITAQTSGVCDVVLLGGPTASDAGCAVASDVPALTAVLTDRAHHLGIANPWVMGVDAGDVLSPLALASYAAASSAHPDALLFYADDDLISFDGSRTNPHFKPAWNAELACHHDFLWGACIFACDPSLPGGQWPPAALPLDPAPVHVPSVLHHRVARPDPVRPTPAVLVEADLPHVSVIIPTRNAVDLMRTVMAGLDATRYPSFDVTVIDNESDDPAARAFLAELATRGVRVTGYPGPFNYAAMHNAVVPSVEGPLVCLLNNDIEITDPCWMAIMAQQCCRDEIGAVGARLLYPDGTIQHAGIVTGVGGGAGHAHRNQPADAVGYFDRANLPQFVSAVTAACMILRKDRFEAVGGFDSANFAVAFNDVDLCLKLNARGWQSFYEPRATLIHHESKSRGFDRSGPQKKRFDSELAALKRIWHTDQKHDPFHHPELSQFGEAFAIHL